MLKHALHIMILTFLVRSCSLLLWEVTNMYKFIYTHTQRHTFCIFICIALKIFLVSTEQHGVCLVQHQCPEQGHLKQITYSSVQGAFKISQDRNSATSVPVLDHPKSKEGFPQVQMSRLCPLPSHWAPMGGLCLGGLSSSGF